MNEIKREEIRQDVLDGLTDGEHHPHRRAVHLSMTLHLESAASLTVNTGSDVARVGGQTILAVVRKIRAEFGPAWRVDVVEENVKDFGD